MYKYYYGAIIYDCTSKTPISNGGILLKDNRIESVGKVEDVEKLVPEDAQRVNITGKYIIPGLIDCHVHMLMNSVNIETMLMTPKTLALFQGVHNLKNTLRMGFTTVRDCGGCDVGIKKAIEQKYIQGPRLFTCGILTPTGGHNETYFPNGMSLEIEAGNYDTIYDGVDGVRVGARKKLREAYDFLKVTATGGINSPQTDATAPQYTIPELKVVVEESLMRGKKMVVAHCHGGQGLRNALQAGIRSIEHGTWMDDEEVQMMLDADAYYVPTLYISEYMNKRSDIIASYAREKTKKAGTSHDESFKRALKAGVKIALGTDAANEEMHGTNARELILLVQNGMDPMEALFAGTRNAAELLEYDHEIGTLEPKKLADFVILEKNPVEDFSILLDASNILVVIKDGEEVKF